MATTVVELEGIVSALACRVLNAEAEIAALKANLGTGKTAVRATEPIRQAETDGVRIFHPVEGARIALPSEAEMQLLLDAVLKKYPKLRPWTPGSRYEHQDRADFFAKFCKAFAFVASKGRSGTPDTRHSLAWWGGSASDFLGTRGYPDQIGGGHVLVAAIAAGDVGFVQADEFGNVWEIALATFGGEPATEAWRNVLRGEFRSPMPGRHRATR